MCVLVVFVVEKGGLQLELPRGEDGREDGENKPQKKSIYFTKNEETSCLVEHSQQAVVRSSKWVHWCWTQDIVQIHVGQLGGRGRGGREGEGERGRGRWREGGREGEGEERGGVRGRERRGGLIGITACLSEVLSFLS